MCPRARGGRSERSERLTPHLGAGGGCQIPYEEFRLERRRHGVAVTPRAKGERAGERAAQRQAKLRASPWLRVRSLRGLADWSASGGSLRSLRTPELASGDSSRVSRVRIRVVE